MRLTLQTDYALRVLMYVGIKGKELSTIPEIVACFGISRGHVMKVVHRLGQLGYLETIRGKGGGLRLAREPAEIGVGAVIRDIEEELGVLGCLQEGSGYCRIEKRCVLRSALRDATHAFFATLDRYTLAELVKPRQALERLITIDVTAIQRSTAGSRRPAATS
jgi:Rrf2 family transcriptional regulator, nitric oxide-sensitive transcriptional repressor